MAIECKLSTGKLPLEGLPRNIAVWITDHPVMTSAVYCGHRGTYVCFYGHSSVLVKKIFRRKFCSYTCTLALNADDDDDEKKFFLFR